MSIKSQSIQSKKDSRQDERLKKISPLRVLLNRPELGALGGSILVFIFFGIIAGDTGMFSAYGTLNFLDVSANLGIIAIAAAMLMIGGEFDLSIGSMIGFAGICIAIPAIYWGWPLWMSIVFAFAMAVLIGYFNGIMVVRTGLPSFIVTLAMLFILRGATLAITRLITGRTQVPGLRVLIEDDPIAWFFATDTFQWLFTWLGSMKLIELRTDGTPLATGIPPSVIWFVALTLIATWILMKTRYGNWIFASGGDKVGATNVGVPVGRVKISLFIGTAVASTIFACIQVLDAGSADTMRGTLKELEAIAAAVVGGCLLTGGYGSAIGAALGAIIFGTVSMGIFYTDIDTDWFKVFLGAMMLIAVVFNNISKFFGKVIALKDVTMKLKKGEIMCLLGDNGAGKSTLIKTLAGVHKPDQGEIIFEDKKIIFDSPREALDIGIGTVYQDLALVSLMSVTRNFFMGREPQKGLPFFKTFDIEKANNIAAERMGQIGIDVRDPSQAVGTMSGGERQCLAISRAIYFGAKVLVLDEPTSALGVHQASMVLKYIVKAASQGLAVILITHNVHHAYPVGNSFTVLNRGKSLGTFSKKEIKREELLGMMAGGEELNKLEVELKEMSRLNS